MQSLGRKAGNRQPASKGMQSVLGGASRLHSCAAGFQHSHQVYCTHHSPAAERGCAVAGHRGTSPAPLPRRGLCPAWRFLASDAVHCTHHSLAAEEGCAVNWRQRQHSLPGGCSSLQRGHCRPDAVAPKWQACLALNAGRGVVGAPHGALQPGMVQCPFEGLPRILLSTCLRVGGCSAAQQHDWKVQLQACHSRAGRVPLVARPGVWCILPCWVGGC